MLEPGGMPGIKVWGKLGAPLGKLKATWKLIPGPFLRRDSTGLTPTWLTLPGTSADSEALLSFWYALTYNQDISSSESFGETHLDGLLPLRTGLVPGEMIFCGSVRGLLALRRLAENRLGQHRISVWNLTSERKKGRLRSHREDHPVCSDGTASPNLSNRDTIIQMQFETERLNLIVQTREPWILFTQISTTPLT